MRDESDRKAFETKFPRFTVIFMRRGVLRRMGDSDPFRFTKHRNF
ncbi:MAG: hypothetical protein DDT26_01980 [Dehalococcoidia bacterium]|nr:hypothetical protein [Chloroflexota bacterium]